MSAADVLDAALEPPRARACSRCETQWQGRLGDRCFLCGRPSIPIASYTDPTEPREETTPCPPATTTAAP